MSARTKQKKRATMRLVYIDFWSALKMSFLISLVVAAITIVLTLLLWSLLDKLGLVATVGSFLESVAGAQGAALVAGLTFGNVMTFTLVVSLLEVGTGFHSELSGRVVGGWKVTFGSD